jgi:adiponectin receptor
VSRRLATPAPTPALRAKAMGAPSAAARRRFSEGGGASAAPAGSADAAALKPLAPPPQPSVSRLYKAPSWHDFGALRGFRVNFSTADALISTLTVHQDTVNIWSHLLGLAYFVAAVPTTWAALGASLAPQASYAWFGVFLLCAQAQMLTSVLYHTLRCVTKQTSETFLYLDMVGIVCMIAGSFFVGMMQGFFCAPWKAVAYMAAEAAFLGVAMLSVSQALRDGSRWIYAYLSIGASVAFGLVPCLHIYLALTDAARGLPHAQELLSRAYLGCFCNYFVGASAGRQVWRRRRRAPAPQSTTHAPHFPRLFLPAGFVFFLTRFPERFSPGTFDIIGHSHQIWHLFVWLAGRSWLLNMLELNAMLAQTGYSCPL